MDGERDPKTGRFLSGNNGGGRPKGSRNKLGEQFLQDLADEWARSGADVLSRVARDDPTNFAKIVAGLLPKELLVRQTSALDEMTDEQLAERLLGLENLLAAYRAGTAGGNRDGSKRAPH